MRNILPEFRECQRRGKILTKDSINDNISAKNITCTMKSHISFAVIGLVVTFCLSPGTLSAQSKKILRHGHLLKSFTCTVLDKANDSQPVTPVKMDSLTDTTAVEQSVFLVYLRVLYEEGGEARRWEPTEVVSALASMQGSMSKMEPNLFLTATAPDTVTLVVVSWLDDQWNYLCVDPTGVTSLDNGLRLYYIRSE